MESFFKLVGKNGFLFIIPFFLSLKYFLVKTFFSSLKIVENEMKTIICTPSFLQLSQRHPPPLFRVNFLSMKDIIQTTNPPTFFLKKRDKTN